MIGSPLILLVNTKSVKPYFFLILKKLIYFSLQKAYAAKSTLLNEMRINLHNVYKFDCIKASLSLMAIFQNHSYTRSPLLQNVQGLLEIDSPPKALFFLKKKKKEIKIGYSGLALLKN
jgi:hypothetical protein